MREMAILTRARSLFHMHEYARASSLLSNATKPIPVFLRLYARYLAIQASTRGRSPDTDGLRRLREDVNAVKADGYIVYLRGSIERALGLEDAARTSLTAAVFMTPWNWGAWQELAGLTAGANAARSIASGEGLMGALYVAYVCNQIDALEDARRTYERIMEALPSWPYVRAQLAAVLYNARAFDEAQIIYEQLFEEDSERLESADVYSNILFVKEDKAGLALLANRCQRIDPVRLETCVVIGNYMSLRQQHEEAVTYFKRALRLDPNYLSAWTLMGHEYVEMKNAAAAIEAYRRAVDINANDFRAWYGLGQTYELMQMPAFTLHYFRKAASLRPRDARMWCAVGHTYEELDRMADAARCYERAVRCDDGDAVALSKLRAIRNGGEIDDELDAQ